MGTSSDGWLMPSLLGDTDETGGGHYCWKVGELTQYLVELLQADEFLGLPIVILGEVSNLKTASKGHMYFSLRDSEGDALLNCAMWRSYASSLRFPLENGMQVYATGRLNIYPPSGSYSLHVQKVEPIGVGGLQQAYEALKAQLQAEGLFDPSRKKPIPPFPTRLGIVTASTGAVIHDMMRVIRARNWLMDVVLVPVKVQGEGAAIEIAQAIHDLQNPALKLDAIIVGRGGGSFEDLFCFSEEPVVRAIAESTIPIITGIGHEPDFGLADAAADYSAATPTMAAETITPNLHDWQAWVEESRDRLAHSLETRVAQSQEMLATLEDQLAHVGSTLIASYQERLTRHGQTLADGLRESWHAANLSIREAQTALRHQVQGLVPQLQQQLLTHHQALDAFNPLRTLERGYAMVEKAGRPVTSVHEFQAQDALRVRLRDGHLDCVAVGVMPTTPE